MKEMRILGTALFVCAIGLCAYGQEAPEAPEVARAKAEVERLRSLVAAGAVPRNQLEQAEDRIADAEDSAFLRKTLYGTDLTAEQADEMLAAANRRLERRQKAYESAEKLVKAQVSPATALAAPANDVDLARKEFALAETRADVTRQLAAMARAEEDVEAQPANTAGLTERYDGDGVLTTTQFSKVETAFQTKFGKTLPVSAMGETAVHKALGFDHRGRVDVALYPDAPEGVWLRDYLTSHHIPYFAFRHAVPGKATGAHIHIGPGSTRIRNGG
jgi:hypothetical protein